MNNKINILNSYKCWNCEEIFDQSRIKNGCPKCNSDIITKFPYIEVFRQSNIINTSSKSSYGTLF